MLTFKHIENDQMKIRTATKDSSREQASHWSANFQQWNS